MTTTLGTSLLVQAVTVALLRHRLGRSWLQRPVALLVICSVLNQGVGPVLLAIPSIGKYDFFAQGIDRSFIDSANLIMSAAMLAFTIAYLLTFPERTITPERRGVAETAAKVLDWRLLACGVIPLTALTAAGRGYNDGTAAGHGTALATNLASTFFIVLIVLAAAAFLLRHGTRWFLPVLVIQSGLLAVAGERTPVITDSVALILMLRFAGVRVPIRQIMAAGLLTVMAFLAISGARVVYSRNLFYSNSGFAGRLTALSTGILAAGGSQGGPDTPGIVTQVAVRLSGVDFAGGILQSIGEGQPRLSPAYVPESMLLAVPSFIWRSKLAQGVALDPAQLQINDFGLQQINFIPAMPGLYIGFLTPPWLMVLFGLFGLAFGWFERWLLRECTPARLVLFAGAVSAALLYEAGVPTMLVQMRAALVLVIAVRLMQAHRARALVARLRPAIASQRPVATQLRQATAHLQSGRAGEQR